MTRFVALLRAVNVGGTGKLPMADLRAMCEGCGFADVQTYIASGNVVFGWDGPAEAAQVALEAALAAYAGKAVPVLIRTADEMAAILAADPFPDAPGNTAVVVFLPDAPPDDAAARATGVNGEVIVLGRREIYVHYVTGQGSSKLRIPAAIDGTARNMNTVRKLAQMVGAEP